MTKWKVTRKQHFDPETQLYKILSASVDDISQEMVTKTKKEAPVDSGFMRSSVKANIKRLFASISVWAHYAKFVEFGTMYTKANPFFRRAWDDVIRKSPMIISRNVRKYFR